MIPRIPWKNLGGLVRRGLKNTHDLRFPETGGNRLPATSMGDEVAEAFPGWRSSPPRMAPGELRPLQQRAENVDYDNWAADEAWASKYGDTDEGAWATAAANPKPEAGRFARAQELMDPYRKFGFSPREDEGPMTVERLLELIGSEDLIGDPEVERILQALLNRRGVT